MRNSSTLKPIEIKTVDRLTQIFSALLISWDLAPIRIAMAAPVIIPASGKHTATLIFLHGLGDTGHGWASSLVQIKAPHVKVICPTASRIPVTLNGGMQMPSWFDLRSLDPLAAEDEPGIKNAKAKITALIDAEIKEGIPAKRIVLGGFSQGGALALYTGLAGDHDLGGLVILSSWLPMNRQFSSWIKQKSIPILQCHGDSDPLVLYTFGALTSNLLKGACSKVSFKSYSGLGHSSSDAEMEDVRKFLNEVLPNI